MLLRAGVDLKAGGIVEGELVYEQLKMDADACLAGDSRRQSLGMPAQFEHLKVMQQKVSNELDDLVADHRARDQEQAMRAGPAYQELRERFPFRQAHAPDRGRR